VQGIGEGTVKCNQELYQLYRLPDIIRTIRVAVLQWADLVQRMSSSDVLGRTMHFRTEGKIQWGDQYFARYLMYCINVRMLGFQMWWMVARDRQSCKKGLLEIESHCGL
jgi:hypothetical protein